MKMGKWVLGVLFVMLCAAIVALATMELERWLFGFDPSESMWREIARERSPWDDRIGHIKDSVPDFYELSCEEQAAVFLRNGITASVGILPACPQIKYRETVRCPDGRNVIVESLNVTKACQKGGDRK